MKVPNRLAAPKVIAQRPDVILADVTNARPISARHCAIDLIKAQLGNVVLPRGGREVGFGDIAAATQIVKLVLPFRKHGQLSGGGRAGIAGVQRADQLAFAH